MFIEAISLDEKFMKISGLEICELFQKSVLVKNWWKFRIRNLKFVKTCGEQMIIHTFYNL